MINPSLKKRFLLTQLIDQESVKNIVKERSISHNIFQKPKQNLNFSQGPVFDKTGIIERSIVGKAETFMKIQEQQINQAKAINQTNLSSTTMKFVRRISTKKLSSQSKKSQESQQSEQSQQRNDHHHIVRKQEFQVVTKAQILKLLQIIKDRIEGNQGNLSLQNEQNDLQSQKLNLQNQTLLNFENQLKIWNEQISKTIIPTNRNQHDSILNTSQKFRRKIEEIKLNEILKESKGEKPINYWQKSLRQQGHTNKSISLDSQRVSLLSEQGNNLEIIIHPNLSKNEYDSKSNTINGSSKMIHKNKKDFFSDIQNVPYLQINYANEEDINELIIIGVNKFKLEKEFVQEQSEKVQFRLYNQQKEEFINEQLEE